MIFGERLRFIRESKHIAQKELAVKIGVAPNTVCNWEKGKTVPSLYYITSICNALDVTADLLLFGKLGICNG